MINQVGGFFLALVGGFEGRGGSSSVATREMGWEVVEEDNQR